MSDLDKVKAAVRPSTKMFFVETPTNPMMKVADIRAIAAIAKEAGALLTVDNTFLTPYFQRPLTLGADIVVHSGTKYLCGHNDVIAGIAVVKDKALAEHFRGEMKSRGNGLGPFDSWLILRGIKTLSLRMERHNENAAKVARWLRDHEKVKKIYYVGFEDHPRHRYVGQRLQRRRRTVILHCNLVDEGRVGSSRSHRSQFFLQYVQTFFHLFFHGFDIKITHLVSSKYHLMMVPIFSPQTAFITLPSSARANTCIAILLSLHKDAAVESITFKSFSSTSLWVRDSYLIASAALHPV